MAFIFSLERLFASVLTSLIESGHDEYSRRLHLYESLDLIDGIGLGNYEKTLSARRSDRLARELRELMRTEVADYLMPRCDGAVAALRAVQDGFLPSLVEAGRLTIRKADGTSSSVSLDTATSRLLRAVRNAGHGLSESFRTGGDLGVLTSHDLEMDAAVSDIAFLQLLRLVSGHEDLTQILGGHGWRAGSGEKVGHVAVALRQPRAPSG